MLDYGFWEEEEELLWAAISAVYISALLLGVEEGSESLPSEFQNLVNFDTLNTDALRYIEQHHYDLTGGITGTTQKQVQEILSNWVTSGEPLSSLEELLTPIFGENRANMISITEITRAYAEGNGMAWMSTGFVNQVRFNTAVDDRVCPICSPLNGDVFDVDDYGHKPPIHVRCILPDNLVVAPDVLAATKSFYSGNVIELTTSSGRIITVTENHPILTSNGWVFANGINKGMYLVATTNPQRIVSTINPNYNYRPTTIEKLFSSLKESSSMTSRSVPSSPENFYGDGRNIDGNIDIVYSKSLLGSNVESVLSQPICEHGFNRRDVRGSILRTDSTLDFFGNSRGSAFRSNMSFSNLLFSLGFTHGSPFESFGLGLVSNVNSSINESTPKSTSIDTRLASEFVLRFASDISLDEVVNVRNYNYSGHVYDLQTKEYELYICNDIITHNCRCYNTPVVDVDSVLEQVEAILNA